MKKITVEMIMDIGPCEEYPELRVRRIIGKGKTIPEICHLRIPIWDRFWLLQMFLDLDSVSHLDVYTDRIGVDSCIDHWLGLPLPPRSQTRLGNGLLRWVAARYCDGEWDSIPPDSVTMRFIERVEKEREKDKLFR